MKATGGDPASRRTLQNCKIDPAGLTGLGVVFHADVSAWSMHKANSIAIQYSHLISYKLVTRQFPSQTLSISSGWSQSCKSIASALPKPFSQFLRAMSGSNQGFKVRKGEQWWPTDAYAIVTGANKGIGKGVAQLMAQNGLKTIVAARDETRGQQAAEDLKKLTGSSEVYFEQLDISDESSVNAFAKRVKDKYKDVAILVNNAGIAFKGNTFGPAEARQTLDTNFVGTQHVCEAIAPLMNSGGRIVNVCSMAGKQRIIKSPQLLQKFNAAKDAKDVAVLADDFVAAVNQAANSDSGMRDGWPGSMYGVSKLCEATYTRVLAEEYKSKLDVNACCPGYVNTDMTSGRGHKTILGGADTPAFLALLAPKGTTGKFFSDRKEESF